MNGLQNRIASMCSPGEDKCVKEAVLVLKLFSKSPEAKSRSLLGNTSYRRRRLLEDFYPLLVCERLTPWHVGGLGFRAQLPGVQGSRQLVRETWIAAEAHIAPTRSTTFNPCWHHDSKAHKT